ncbi:MAG: MoaD/ThiS family protein [Myxococcales bacterium]|nr:MoaD/ThiS family protein [Myxococcales bacterium]
MVDRTGSRAGPETARPVRVLAFAAVRDIVGAPEIELEIPGRCAVGDLWPTLIARFPALEPHRPSVRLAVNGTYARDDDVVSPGDEVALIPPVAGG